MMDVRVSPAGPGDGRNEHGRRSLEHLRTITLLFDQAFGIPGTKWRFGLDALFGLVPGLGDIAGALVAVYAMRVARRLNVPPTIQLHMLTNIALDAVIGMVPIAGDLFDFAFKAQTRNLALLDDYLATPHKTARRSRRGLVLIGLATIFVFATLGALGLWLLYILFHWLGSLLTGL
jgi:hypothetical protein